MIKVGFGVIGLGEFGRYSLEAYKELPDFELKGTFDPFVPNTHTYDSYESLLNDAEVQLIVINTPNYLHYDHVKQALLANKHVFCEKPLTLDYQQAKELFDLADSKHLQLSCNHPLIFNEIHQRVKKILENRIYGEVLEIKVENHARESTISTQWYWDKRKSGGWFLTSSYHFVDLCNWWLGEGKLLGAKEVKQEDRTTMTEMMIRYGMCNATIKHFLDTPSSEERCLIEIRTEQKLIRVEGWVPEKLDILGVQTTGYANWSKDREYKELLRRSLQDTFQGPAKQLSSKQVVATIRLCAQAQHLADSLDT